MFLSVAVSKAEVASSRSNNFGDLGKKNISGDIVLALKKCNIDNGLFFCRSMFENLQNSQSYVGTGHWTDQPEESPGDRHPLLLSTAQFQPTLSHFCVVAVR